MMELQRSDFEGTKLSKSGTIAVLFAASWCPFCRMFTTTFELRLREKGIEGARVDLSEYDSPLWDSFRIEIVPTVIVFRDGDAVFRRDGTSGVGLDPEIMTDVILTVLSSSPSSRAS